MSNRAGNGRASGVRARCHELLEPARAGDAASRAVDVALIALIVYSVVTMVLESVPQIADGYGGFFRVSEFLVLALFTLEYAARLWSCTTDARFRGAVVGRLRCAARPSMIIDLLAILPSLLPFVGLDLRVFRLVRVFRVFRVFKLGRYSRAFDVIARVVVRTREELFVSLSFVLTLLLISACLMYYAEAEAQPEHFGSIPDAMWWAIVTLTTVGYGDVYPITGAGRLIAGVMAVLAIGLVGLPTGILGAGFVTEMQNQRHKG